MFPCRICNFTKYAQSERMAEKFKWQCCFPWINTEMFKIFPNRLHCVTAKIRNPNLTDVIWQGLLCKVDSRWRLFMLLARRLMPVVSRTTSTCADRANYQHVG